jgi:hypothetical protein
LEVDLANLLRIAILLREGGVYLDTDVIAPQSFVPLLRAGFFCGTERIALLALVARTRNPLRWILPGARLLVRDIFRRLPRGHRCEASWGDLESGLCRVTQPEPDLLSFVRHAPIRSHPRPFRHRGRLRPSLPAQGTSPLGGDVSRP